MSEHESGTTAGEETNEYQCECGETFDSPQSYAGHSQHCEGAAEETEETDESETVETDDSEETAEYECECGETFDSPQSKAGHVQHCEGAAEESETDGSEVSESQNSDETDSEETEEPAEESGGTPDSADKSGGRTVKEHANLFYDSSRCLSGHLIRYNHGESYAFATDSGWSNESGSLGAGPPTRSKASFGNWCRNSEGVHLLGSDRKADFLRALSAELGPEGHKVSFDPETAEEIHVSRVQVPVVVARGPAYRLGAYLAAHGFSNGEIARAFDVSDSTVAVNLSKYKSEHLG